MLHAENRTRAELPDGLALVIDGYKLKVAWGKHAAPLTACAPVEFANVSVSTDRKHVTFGYTGGACVDQTDTWSFASLEARLRNISGLALHRKKEHTKAALDFAAAIELDPAFDLAASNLACTKVAAGQANEGIQAIAPWLAKNPVDTYARVAKYPELHPLLIHPQIAVLRSPAPGIAIAGSKSVFIATALFAGRTLIATVRVEESWGSNSWKSDLEIFDRQDSKELSRLPLVEDSDAEPSDSNSGNITPQGKKALRPRLALANQVLKDLGFHTPPGAEVGDIRDESGKEMVVVFGKSGIRMSDSRDKIRIHRAGKPLVTVSNTSFVGINRASFIPDSPTIVYIQREIDPEGCSSCAGITSVGIVPIPGR